ncbi:hypothetical protein FA95DRAFT_1505189 [Auriscalpium vulgare]|uniref:Uncharacterized protein n=1 Tax=Auriscalpium vulgare TaxID=40419 RepID=A0ACB8R498_9AGAM|nr:hypothetical protein FA95DRAFT_1505189 [Auriscalpium vulgare]
MAWSAEQREHVELQSEDNSAAFDGAIYKIRAVGIHGVYTNLTTLCALAEHCLDVRLLEVRVPATEQRGTAGSLLHRGLLPSAPLSPTVAITIHCMELYRLAHLRCPSLSIQAWVHTLCDFHGTTFRRHLVRQFSIAYDLYLSIRSAVEARVLVALARAEPDWRLRNCCPACTYRLDGEQKLTFSILYTMDGGNSLKRVLRREESAEKSGEELGPSAEMRDGRVVSGDYYLSREDVDRHAHATNVVPPGAGPPPIVSLPTACASRWDNMAPDLTKKMWGVYDETGIFISVCRHGFLLVLADMVRSGELSKYPLAVTEKLLNTFGKDLGGGYDIGCGFAGTLARSSVGPLARSLNHTSLVGAFHGHAHNRACQLKLLAIYVDGLGLEDLEGGERVFSKSNALAASLRYSSVFHRKQGIATFFRHSDVFETYRNLSTFLLNNYKQALTILETAPSALAKAMRDLGIEDATTFEAWRAEEKEYLANLQKEPLVETLEMEYVVRLAGYYKSRCVAATNVWQAAAPNCDAVGNRDRTRTNERKRRQALEAQTNNLAAVAALESKLKIEVRWTNGCPEWNDATALTIRRNYQRALDTLEGLVVARMFELTKMNMSQTGYKLRKHIAKALQSRSAAIRTALTRYNNCAVALKPPRRVITWEEVVEYAFLADFDLLRDTRQDIRQRPWANPGGRLAMDLFYKILRAREEIQRLNVEIPRFATFLRDEHLFLTAREAAVRSTDVILAHQIRLYRLEHGRFDEFHTERLHAIASLPKFSGSIECGTRAPEVTGYDLDPAPLAPEPPDPDSTLPALPEHPPSLSHRPSASAPLADEVMPSPPPQSSLDLGNLEQLFSRARIAEDQECEDEQEGEEEEEKDGQDIHDVLLMFADSEVA